MEEALAERFAAETQPAVESRPLPELAMTAARLAQDQFNRLVNEIGAEVLEAMGLSAKDGWRVNFDTRRAERPAPKPPQ
jgi:hypothetical protein